ncbi:hypothetical protein Hamer_G029624, partial [Homarus americanus]
TQSRQNYVLESVPARNRRLVQQESSGSRKRSTAVNNRGCKSVGSQRSVTQIGDNSSKMKKVSTVTPEKENEIFKKKEWVTVNKDSKKSGPPLSRTDAVHIADVKSVQETTVTTSKPKRKLESTREGRVRTKKMKTLESGTSATNDNNNNSDLKIETKDEIERVSNPPMQQVVSHDHGYLKAPSFHKYEVKEREAAVGEVLTAEGRPKYPGQDSTQTCSMKRFTLNREHVESSSTAYVRYNFWFQNALEYLLKSYKAIVLHMQQIQNLRLRPEKPRTTCSLPNQCGAVPWGASQELFQHGQTNISAIVNEIQTAIDVLNKYLTWPGPSLRKDYGRKKLSGRSNTFKTARHDMLTSLIFKSKQRFINIVLDSPECMDFEFQIITVGMKISGIALCWHVGQALENTDGGEVNPTLVEDEWIVLKEVKFSRSRHHFCKQRVLTTNPDKAIANSNNWACVWMASLTLLQHSGRSGRQQ